ncbi:hypothetical protein TEA_011905 [Camellia sinensis var. sinensis]|uniref:Protein kinase domain-containing protein n=1 Tax=Camellia sinensis var. sinensis TaxID=542762 RepID=A0A4S4ELA8_CAMSN|nr:hypothetical protein TEA_011905 [Camellia sinensis var. sinensis]
MKVKNGLNRYPFLSMIMFLALMHIGHLTVPIWANRSPYTPTDYFLFECLASTAATLLSNGQKWSPNNNSNFEYYPYHEVSKASQISGDPKSPQSLYACIVRKQSSFTFAVSSIGMHFIRLHFYPTSYEGLNMSKALFSVSVANYTLLRTSESSYSSNPSDAKYIIKEFCINVDDLVINVAFTPSRNSSGAYGFVNKIEIVSMPQDIYYVRRGDDQLPFIGHHSKFFTGNSIALEMMYRLNVGGHSIYAEDDTGMLRAWSEDFSFLINQITDIIHPKVNIKYSLSVPAYIAPQQIYATARTMEDNGHYVIHWSGGVGVPVYRDYIVNVTKNSQEMFLSLALKSTESLNGPILNGLEIFKLSDHAYNLAGPFPFGKRTHPFGMWFPFHSNLQRRTFKLASSDHCRYFTLVEIKSATNNFSDANLIGAGGFGKVYKGYIDGGATSVAIKRGSPTSHQGLHEFHTEITILTKLKHNNLVSRIGYCVHEKEMILVYEFMARGTLRDHLYNTQKPPLQWKERLKICIGAARGLNYLHVDAKQTIIHRDVKTTNILLDESWVAKVSDFGLSKFGPKIMSCTHVSTVVKGSFGYIDPEYYRCQKLTEKSDVYSFGVVLMEVLCARPAVLPMVMEEEEDKLEQANLAEWALHCHQSGTLHHIIDPFLKEKIDPECFKTFVELAKKCLAGRGSERPTMGDVLWYLELAQQQQEANTVEEKTCIASEEFVTIDVQYCARGIGNSNATLGAEFSELMDPVGR